MLFTATTDVSVQALENGGGTMGIYADLVGTAGAATMYGLDGGSSVALAHRNESDVLTTRCKGAKHTSSPFNYWVNTYLMFKSTKPR